MGKTSERWHYYIVRWVREDQYQIRSDSKEIMDWLGAAGQWEVLTPPISLPEAKALFALYPKDKQLDPHQHRYI